MKVLLVYPNTMMATLPPISIAILSAVLKKEGFEVKLFDTTFYKTEEISFEKKKEELLQVKPFKETAEYKGDLNACLKDFYNMVDNYKPDLIGISLVEDTIDLGLQLLATIKGYNIPVIAGGVGVNFNYDILEKSGLIDQFVFGEAENLIRSICTIKSPTGLWQDSRAVDLNKIPFLDYSIFESNRLNRIMSGKSFRMLHFELDRGCPYECSYCCADALKRLYGVNYYRRKKNSRIIEEMLYLKEKYNPDYFNFNSETFLARTEKELVELMTLYTRDISLPFWCQSRPETVTKEKIAILKTMGVADFQLGIEHGNASFRKEWLNRKNTNEQIINACKILNDYEIPYTVNNLIGFAHETKEHIFDTINLNKEIDFKYLKNMNVYVVNPYKGTELFRRYLEEGLIEEDAKSMQLLNGKKINRLYLSDEEVFGLQRTFPLYVKMPEQNSRIKRAEKMDDFGNNVYQSLRREYIKRFYK